MYSVRRTFVLAHALPADVDDDSFDLRREGLVEAKQSQEGCEFWCVYIREFEAAWTTGCQGRCQGRKHIGVGLEN